MTSIIPGDANDASDVQLRVALEEFQTGEDVLQDRPERIMKLADALLAARNEHADDIGFGVWLAKRQLDTLSRDDRAALINMARHPDLSRRVLCRTDRISVRLIWEREIKPETTKSAMGMLLPFQRISAALESLRDQGVSQRCETDASRNDSAVPEKPQENQQTTLSISDQADSAKQSLLTKLPTGPAKNRIASSVGYYGRPRMQEVIALYKHANARIVLSKAMKEGAGAANELWSLILTCVDNGLLKENNHAPIVSGGKVPLRLLLSDLPGRVGANYDLAAPGSRREVRRVVLPAVLEQKEAYLRDPGSLDRLINQWKLKSYDAAVAGPQAPRPAVVAPLDTPAAVTMFGTQLWPIVEARFGTYDYEQLRLAIWAFLDLQDWLGMTSDTSPKSRAITTRFSTRFYEAYAQRALDEANSKQMCGVFQMVHALASLMEQNPQGRCVHPVRPHGDLGWD